MAPLSQPTTRSRTGLFLSYRDSRAPSAFPRYADADNDEHDRLITPASHLSLDVLLPPKWVDYTDRVHEILAETQAKVATLDKLHAKHVLPGFSDRSQEEREIEALTTDITRDFRRCQALIQKVGSDPQSHSFPPNAQTSHNQTLAAKNVQRGLAAKVQDLSSTFRKKQRVYMEKLQGHAIKNQDILIASGTLSLKGSDGMTAVDDDVAAASHTQNQSLSLVQHDPETADLQMRDRALSEIAKSIAQLAELFKDLSVLVIDQGTLLDSVEYNIEQTAIRMEDSVKELDVAQTYQQRTGRRKCIFLLLLIIFGLIIVLIFKPRRHIASTPSPPSISTSAPGVSGVGEVDIDGVRLLRR